MCQIHFYFDNTFIVNMKEIKLIYLGKELDTKIEHELITDHEFGFNVRIKYTPESFYKLSDKEQFFNNCTEVHYMFEGLDGRKNRVAFESDLHGTGCNREIESIESIEIMLANKMEDNW